jgi:hypothetical protein
MFTRTHRLPRLALASAFLCLMLAGNAHAQSSGLWVSADELRLQPMSGAAWTAVLNDANRDPGPANIADQDSHHDTYTLAAAIVAARTGQSSYYLKAKKGILDAMGTEFKTGTRWLAAGRNVLAYVIAADLLNLRRDGSANSDGTKVDLWIRGWLTKQLPDNNNGVLRPIRPFGGGSNADAQEGAVFAAVAVWADDPVAITRGWDAFRTYACDPNGPNYEDIDLQTGLQYNWAADPKNPCAVNPLNSTKVVPAGFPGAGTTHRMDGAIINDMRRGGAYQWSPAFTQYPWTGLAGFIPAAVILQRAGYPALQVADKAVLRTVDYLFWLKGSTGLTSWFDGKRGSEVVQLVNHYYGTKYPTRKPVARGHTVAYTDFTHP